MVIVIGFKKHLMKKAQTLAVGNYFHYLILCNILVKLTDIFLFIENNI
jgi:hypothetical protein